MEGFGGIEGCCCDGWGRTGCEGAVCVEGFEAPVYYFLSPTGFCGMVSFWPNRLVWCCCWAAGPVANKLGFCSPACCPNNDPPPPIFKPENNDDFSSFLAVDGASILFAKLGWVDVPNKLFDCYILLGNDF